MPYDGTVPHLGWPHLLVVPHVHHLRPGVLGAELSLLGAFLAADWLFGAAVMLALLVQHVQHSLPSVLGTELGLRDSFHAVCWLLGAPWVAIYLLPMTFTILPGACCRQKTACLLPSTPYAGYLVHPWWLHSVLFPRTIPSLGRAGKTHASWYLPSPPERAGRRARRSWCLHTERRPFTTPPRLHSGTSLLMPACTWVPPPTAAVNC